MHTEYDNVADVKKLPKGVSNLIQNDGFDGKHLLFQAVLLWGRLS